MHSFVPLTPTTFLERAGRTFPKREAVCYPGGSVSFGQLLDRTRRLAQGLRELGVTYGDRIALLSDNRLQIIEAHFAIPALGAVIVSCNPWLPSGDIADQLAFCDAKLVIASAECLANHADIFARKTGLQHVVSLGSNVAAHDSLVPILGYDRCLAYADDCPALDQEIRSELDPIAINFTSGTTGVPKGVVFSHRAAYLHAIGQVLMLGLSGSSRYLWTLPMFHVNGWGHMWASVAAAAMQIIVPEPDGSETMLHDQIETHQATHLAGAPRLVRTLIDTPDAGSIFRNLTVVTGGAAPSPILLIQLEELGVRLIHQYGLNETCGPYVVCEEQTDWKDLPAQTRTEMRMRQGMAALHAGTGLRVVDADMRDVPADGKTLGEVVMAGNTVATGYFNNEDATRKAFVDGWFHSGDMAVVHPDGYIEIKDRIKDLIYVETDYGWENISSIEVENVIGRCAGLKDVAVVGLTVGADGKEGTLLIAFLERSSDADPTEDDLRRHCAQSLAGYKQPHYFVFGELPKTATGKIRKDLLVDKATTRFAPRSQPGTAHAPDRRHGSKTGETT